MTVLKVLILEDNPFDAELILATLKKEFRDIESRVVVDEGSFTDCLYNFSPDIILSDFLLAGFSGMDALRISYKISPLIPFIIVTGSLGEEKAAECIKNGAWDFVLKERLVRLNQAVKYALKLQEERKQREVAEAKLVQSEKLPSRLLDNIQIGVYRIQIDGTVLYSNKKAEKITGYASSKIIEENLFKVLELCDLKGNSFTEKNNPFSRVAKSLEEITDVICQIKNQAGQIKSISLCITPDNIVDKRFNQFILSFQDVSDRLKIEETLKTAETRYEAVFNNVKDAIFLYDVETLELVDVNDRATSLYGYSKDEIFSLNMSNLSAREFGYTGKIAMEIAQKAIQGQEQHQEWLAQDKKGRHFWIRVTLKNVRIGGTDFLLGIVTDINQQKLAEISLKESEEHYRALAQNSPDVIMRFDRNGRHLFVNNAIFDQLAIKPEEFINKTHKEMGIFDPGICDFWEEHIMKVFESQKPTEVEFTIPSPTGLIYIEWRLFPEFNPNGEVITVLAVARDISYKKAAQDALRISEERFQMALDATSDGLWDWNLETNEIYFSNRYFNMLGYQPNEFHHDLRLFEILLHPDDKLRILEYLNEIVQNNIQSLEMEFRMLKKDGTYAWHYSRGKVFSAGEKGKVRRMVGTQVDITSRKRQEAIQKTILDIGNAVVTTRNLDELFEKIQEILGNVIDTKNCYVALYDEKSDTITLPFHRDEKDKFTEFPAGKTMTSFVIRSGKAQLVSEERVKELADAGEIEDFGAASVSWLGVPLIIDNKIIGVFTVQSYDEAITYSEEDVKILEFVSDQIALAIARKKDEDNIRENEQKLRRIIESSPDGLLVTGSDGKIIDHNTSIFELLRITKKDLHSRNFLDFLNKADIKKVNEIFKETIKSGFQKNIDFKMMRDDDTEFYAEISLGLIQNSKNVRETFVIIIKDITERINYETNLRIEKDKAEESDRLKSSFLSNMSHEIRTPMNAIVGFAELLSQENLEAKDKKEFVSHINQGADSLLNLIDDIIDISKIEAGQIRVVNSPFHLSSLLLDLAAVFNKNLRLHGRDNLKIIIDNNDIDPDINLLSDSFRLKQIFTNLINNAVKFTESGEVKFGIKSLDSKQISFYVRDTGIGIQKDKQLIIFDRFRQGHDSKAKFYGGTGLGLAISKHLVELLGGKISLKSDLGEGSEFIFSIDYSFTGKELLQDDKQDVAKITNWKKKTILIAEDESSNFLMLKEVLKPTLANIIWAKDGHEVVKLFKKNPRVNLVLMDIQLPLLDGYKATAKIKKIRKDIPVIAQTAYAMAGEMEKSRDAGCDNYISKPIKPSELIKMLGHYLNS